MNIATKLGGFLAALTAVFAIAAGVGNAVGPVSAATERHGGDHTTTRSDDEGHEMTGTSGGHGGAREGARGADTDNRPGGLMVSEHGYTLDLRKDNFDNGQQVPVAFTIRDADGRPVLAYTETHDKDLHFIAVRRDMTGFQHVHPTQASNGEWQTTLELDPGSWRFFADFQPAQHGETMTLGADAAVAGNFRPVALPAPASTTTVDGYTVELDGALVPGETSKLTLSVSRNGEPVTDLQPYLAAYGHLVALRAGDLGYLHVHPDGEPGDGHTTPGPRITFYAEVPSDGHYRLYLDFKHEGEVRTAEFTAQTASDNATRAEPEGGTQGDGRDDHGDGGHSH